MKTKQIVAACLVAAIAVFGAVLAPWPRVAAADDNGTVTIAADQTVDGALYAADQTVTVNGTVKGDVYCAAQTVTVSGIVEGDVICAAQTLKIAGEVLGDVRVAGQSVSLDGTVAGTVTSFAQTIDLTEKAVVGRDFGGGAQTITIDGLVRRDALAGAETAVINGEVGRNVGGEYAALTVSPTARIGGALRYTSDKEATVASGAVAGEVVRSAPVREQPAAEDTVTDFVGMAIYNFLAMLLIALVLVLVAPRIFRTVTENGVHRFLPSMLTGFFVLFAGPFIVGMVALTVIGIPLAILLLLGWLILLILSGPAFAFYMGRFMLEKRTTHAVLTMAAGATALLVIYLIPIVNIIVLFIAGTVGTGMIVLEIARRYPKPVYAPERVENVKEANDSAKKRHKNVR